MYRGYSEDLFALQFPGSFQTGGGGASMLGVIHVISLQSMLCGHFRVADHKAGNVSSGKGQEFLQAVRLPISSCWDA